MLKIRLIELFRHRAETTWRPFIENRNIFRDIGIQFITEGDDYDLSWVTQATYANKIHPFKAAVNYGKNFIERIDGDVIMFDGSDSPSLMGSWDVFKDSKAKLLLKNSLYSDRNEYSMRSIHGRNYWGESQGEWEYNYSIPLKDLNSKKFKDVKLSGTNWLSTIRPKWQAYNANKDIDVCALFSYPAKENKEFQRFTNQFYDAHRQKCIEEINKLPSSIRVAKLENGQKIPIGEYYNLMSRSKIILAPFGYGEMAPRDIEATMFGGILLKPSMDHIETTPNPYNEATFASCKWDYSDLIEKIEGLVGDFRSKQGYFVENMRRTYEKLYDPIKLVEFTHNWLSNLDGFGTE